MEPFTLDSQHHFLLTNTIYASMEEVIVKTILGSCVAVCLWDETKNIGGINHYLMPLWNGEGLETPKYGNVAIEKLINKMEYLGCKKENIIAKVFGGAAVLTEITNRSGLLNIGERNIHIAKEVLEKHSIPILSIDVGGELGRILVFNTKNGKVYIKQVKKS